MIINLNRLPPGHPSPSVSPKIPNLTLETPKYNPYPITNFASNMKQAKFMWENWWDP